ncbi:hypothetical protein HDV02_001412 [Globomyces sp. JEL0801]|nr:hypothetical protein HDV02_001412 [Globomyces sp. JEL0801]
MALTIYVILRRDLLKLGFGPGSMISQACHGTSKLLWEYKNDPQVIEYMNDIENMHKVILEIKNLNQLELLGNQLTNDNIGNQSFKS